MSTNVINQMPYLRTSRGFPEDPRELTVQVNKSYVDIASAVNARTIGLFPTTRPAITGEAWFISGNKKQQTLRQIYPFGAIAAGMELDIPHDIKNIVGFTKIYGTVITNIPDYRPLPYIDPGSLTTGMALLVNATNIRIVLGATAAPVTSGIVVLEWLSAP